jgi:hypothetical protein
MTVIFRELVLRSSKIFTRRSACAAGTESVTEAATIVVIAGIFLLNGSFISSQSTQG